MHSTYKSNTARYVANMTSYFFVLSLSLSDYYSRIMLIGLNIYEMKL